MQNEAVAAASEPPFLLDGYSVKRLAADDLDDLQALHERCRDYFLLIEGGPPRPSSAEEDFSQTPPGKDQSDKFLLGIYSRGRELIAVLDLIRDHPAACDWWLGLLLLDPKSRGAGIGSRIYGAAQRWIAAQGGRVIYLAVLEQNVGAHRFWSAQGFKERRRSNFKAASGLISGSIVMSQEIPRSPLRMRLSDGSERS